MSYYWLNDVRDFSILLPQIRSIYENINFGAKFVSARKPPRFFVKNRERCRKRLKNRGHLDSEREQMAPAPPWLRPSTKSRCHPQSYTHKTVSTVCVYLSCWERYCDFVYQVPVRIHVPLTRAWYGTVTITALGKSDKAQMDVYRYLSDAFFFFERAILIYDVSICILSYF